MTPPESERPRAVAPQPTAKLQTLRLGSRLAWLTLSVVLCVSGARTLTPFAFSGALRSPAAQQLKIENAQYTHIELSDVESYSPKSAGDLVVTTGTVAGIRVTPYELVLTDDKGEYLLVTFARAFTSVFAPIASSVKVGDVVEVTGTARRVPGVLANSPSGTTIETMGVNLAHARSFGAITLTGIRRVN